MKGFFATTATALVLGITISCALAAGFPDRCAVSAAPVPEAWAGFPLEWTLELSGVVAGSSRDARFTLFLDRARREIVILRPSIHGIGLAPFGALYPRDVSPDGAIICTPSGGYEAELACALDRAGMDWRLFDTGRFRMEATARLDDPWELPPQGFVRAIVEDRFRADMLRPPARFGIDLPCPEDALAPASPFASRLFGSDGLANAVLPVGMSSFAGHSGALRVSVDADGDPTIAYTPYRGP
ncbi:MAG: hypothetical protein NT080_05055 [Spirochaetes bacterium]|nr:hypothetical protein [Spirochaetota bacterium]